MKMFVAISQRHDQHQHGWWMDHLENHYNNYLSAFGIRLLPLPNDPDGVGPYFAELPIAAVILTGGNDISPTLYGEQREWPGSSLLRDLTEKRILELAVQRKLPLLGICRGMQFINVFFGGKLQRDINKERPVHPPGENHLIHIVDEGVQNMLGVAAMVNSFHNQVVTKETLSPALNLFALAEKDGIVEGIYHPALPIAGIQWHPERESPHEEINRRIITAFVERKLFWKH